MLSVYGATTPLSVLATYGNWFLVVFWGFPTKISPVLILSPAPVRQKEALCYYRMQMEGFFMYIRADGYADNTIKLYGYMLDPLLKHLGDKEMEDISQDDLLEFFVYLREVYHVERGHEALSGSMMQNFWKSIRTFFGWARTQKLISARPDAEIKMPRNNPEIVMPLEEEEVKALIQGAEYSHEANVSTTGHSFAYPPPGYRYSR